MADKTVEVKRHTYKRTIKERPVTFKCKCHPGGAETITEKRLPGPLPHYCLSCQESGRAKKYKAALALARYYGKTVVTIDF